jgi:hypothetical protein
MILAAEYYHNDTILTLTVAEHLLFFDLTFLGVQNTVLVAFNHLQVRVSVSCFVIDGSNSTYQTKFHVQQLLFHIFVLDLLESDTRILRVLVLQKLDHLFGFHARDTASALEVLQTHLQSAIRLTNTDQQVEGRRCRSLSSCCCAGSNRLTFLPVKN